MQDSFDIDISLNLKIRIKRTQVRWVDLWIFYKHSYKHPYFYKPRGQLKRPDKTGADLNKRKRRVFVVNFERNFRENFVIFVKDLLT